MGTPEPFSAVEWIAFGPYVLLPGKRTLNRDGNAVRIGDRTFDLLLALIASPGEVMSKTDLARRVWQREWIEEATVRVTIAALRKLLGQMPDGEEYVVTVVGRGYAFSASANVEHSSGRRFERKAGRAIRAVPESGRLPALLSPILGRQTDIRQIGDLLAMHRLVTIVGTGGIGKTTTAVSCAAQRTEIGDGVRFVDFGPIRDPVLVPARIAAALDAEQTIPDPWSFVINQLGPRRQLLVLDNCEHVADAAASMVEEILRSAPNVTIMATSREPLRAAGEVVFRLGALSLPEADDVGAADAMTHSAIQLFVDRVQAGLPDFILTDGLAPTAIDICRRLDGIALAIRLAAGRVPAFGVKGVAGLLDDRFRVLSRGQRTAPARHQTLEAAFDWSYELLAPAEQMVLARIAAFAHTFTLDAAKNVAASSPIEKDELAEIIGNLVSKSLVVFIQDEIEPTYRLLETVRVFASARLSAAGEEAATLERHARYCAEQCKASLAEMTGSKQSGATHAAKAALDDIRAALRWSLQAGDPVAATETVSAVLPVMLHLGLVAESGDWIERVLAIETDSRRRLELMISLGSALILSTPHWPTIVKLYEEANNLACELDDVTGQLQAIHGLMVAAWNDRRCRDALAIATRHHDLAVRHGRSEDVVMSRCMIAAAHHGLGEFHRASEHLQFMLANYPAERRSADVQRLFDMRTVALGFVARIEFSSGRISSSQSIAEQALAEAGDHVPSVFLVLSHIASPIAIDCMDWASAEKYIERLYEQCGHQAWWRIWADTLNDIFAVHAGQSEEALRRLDSFIVEDGGFRQLAHHCWFYLQVVKGHMAFGNHERARGLLTRLLAHVDACEDFWLKSELLTLEACLTAKLDPERAAEGFRNAIRLARAQGAALFELGAAAGFVRFARGTAIEPEARRSFAEAYARSVSSDGQSGTGRPGYLRKQFRRLVRLQGISRPISGGIPPAAVLAAE
ncbi:Predicted ATPase [Bradyrhizobium erythrophlei]|nr:Predicted ATPase [Bradyrhizobium erythrophlei]